MADFEKGFAKILRYEGGYVNHPYDKGGETNHGITERTARKHGYTGEMNKLPLVTAKEIYKKSYWNALHLDDVNSNSIACELFDIGVNMGVITAAVFLQKALNLLNNNERRWKDLVEDGVVGIKTIGTLNDVLKRGKKYEIAILKALNGEQYARYRDICKRDKDQEVFMLGWLMRVWDNF